MGVAREQVDHTHIDLAVYYGDRVVCDLVCMFYCAMMMNWKEGELHSYSLLFLIGQTMMEVSQELHCPSDVQSLSVNALLLLNLQAGALDLLSVDGELCCNVLVEELCGDDSWSFAKNSLAYGVTLAFDDSNTILSLSLCLSLSDRGQPNEVVQSLIPVWNNFIFFDVNAVSFHQVSSASLYHCKHTLPAHSVCPLPLYQFTSRSSCIP